MHSDGPDLGGGHPVVAGLLVGSRGVAALLSGLATGSPAVVVISALVVALVLGIGVGKFRHWLAVRRPTR